MASSNASPKFSIQQPSALLGNGLNFMNYSTREERYNSLSRTRTSPSEGSGSGDSSHRSDSSHTWPLGWLSKQPLSVCWGLGHWQLLYVHYVPIGHTQWPWRLHHGIPSTFYHAQWDKPRIPNPNSFIPTRSLLCEASSARRIDLFRGKWPKLFE